MRFFLKALNYSISILVLVFVPSNIYYSVSLLNSKYVLVFIISILKSPLSSFIIITLSKPNLSNFSIVANSPSFNCKTFRNNQSDNALFGFVINALEFSWQTFAEKISPDGICKLKSWSRFGKKFGYFLCNSAGIGIYISPKSLFLPFAFH